MTGIDATASLLAADEACVGSEPLHVPIVATSHSSVEPAIDIDDPCGEIGDSIATRYVNDHARKIGGEAAPITDALANARYQTPLRYPGAKTGLSTVISRILAGAVQSRSVGRIDLLVEPFAGGASTSLRLVGNDIVRRVLLADADPLVAAFWQVAAAEPDKLIARMREEHVLYIARGGDLALERWDYWRAWRPSLGTSTASARFESAVKCLFLNRTTFSGILHGRAGPIGGRSQKSDYEIGCRFNPDSLARRISYVGHLYETGRIVDVWCMDWRDTLDNTASAYKALLPNRVVAYLDPPYLRKSATLYNRSFGDGRPARPVPAPAGWPNTDAHVQLASYLNRKMRYRWLLSYDYDPELLESCLLYGRDRMNPAPSDRLDGVKAWRINKRAVTLTYTAAAGRGRTGSQELLLTTLPPGTVPDDEVLRSVT